MPKRRAKKISRTLKEAELCEGDLSGAEVSGIRLQSNALLPARTAGTPCIETLFFRVNEKSIKKEESTDCEAEEFLEMVRELIDEGRNCSQIVVSTNKNEGSLTHTEEKTHDLLPQLSSIKTEGEPIDKNNEPPSSSDMKSDCDSCPQMQSLEDRISVHVDSSEIRKSDFNSTLSTFKTKSIGGKLVSLNIQCLRDHISSITETDASTEEISSVATTNRQQNASVVDQSSTGNVHTKNIALYNNEENSTNDAVVQEQLKSNKRPIENNPSENIQYISKRIKSEPLSPEHSAIADDKKEENNTDSGTNRETAIHHFSTINPIKLETEDDDIVILEVKWNRGMIPNDLTLITQQETTQIISPNSNDLSKHQTTGTATKENHRPIVDGNQQNSSSGNPSQTIDQSFIKDIRIKLEPPDDWESINSSYTHNNIYQTETDRKGYEEENSLELKNGTLSQQNIQLDISERNRCMNSRQTLTQPETSVENSSSLSRQHNSLPDKSSETASQCIISNVRIKQEPNEDNYEKENHTSDCSSANNNKRSVEDDPSNRIGNIQQLLKKMKADSIFPELPITPSEIEGTVMEDAPETDNRIAFENILTKLMKELSDETNGKDCLINNWSKSSVSCASTESQVVHESVRETPHLVEQSGSTFTEEIGKRSSLIPTSNSFADETVDNSRNGTHAIPFSTVLLNYIHLNVEIDRIDVRNCLQSLSESYPRTERFDVFYSVMPSEKVSIQQTEDSQVSMATPTVLESVPLNSDASEQSTHFAVESNASNILPTFTKDSGSSVNILSIPESRPNNSDSEIVSSPKDCLTSLFADALPSSEELRKIITNVNSLVKSEAADIFQNLKNVPCFVNNFHNENSSMEVESTIHSDTKASNLKPESSKSEFQNAKSTLFRGINSLRGNNQNIPAKSFAAADINIGIKENNEIVCIQSKLNGEENENVKQKFKSPYTSHTASMCSKTARQCLPNAVGKHGNKFKMSAGESPQTVSALDARDPRMRKNILTQTIHVSACSDREPQARKESVASDLVHSTMTSVAGTNQLLQHLEKTSTQNTIIHDTNISSSDITSTANVNQEKRLNSKETPENKPLRNVLSDLRKSASKTTPSEAFDTRRGNEALILKGLHKNVGKTFIETKDLSSLILEWNATWLSTQEAKLMCPPICDGYRYVKDTYESALDYYNTYLPLHLLSIWMKISDSWKKSATIHNCVYERQEDRLNFVKLECSTVISISDIAIWPKREDIVLITSLKSGKATKQLFGRVTNVMHKDYSPSDATLCTLGTWKKVKFHCLCAEALGAQVHDHVTIQILCNLRIDLLKNDALLSKTSSKGIVLNPVHHKFLIQDIRLVPSNNDLFQKCIGHIVESAMSPQILMTLVDTSPPCDNILAILHVACRIMRNNLPVLICAKHESFSKLADYLKNANLVLAVKAKEMKLSEEFKKFLVEERLAAEKGRDFFKKGRVILTVLSFIYLGELKDVFCEQQPTCIVEDAHLCTEAETALLFHYNVKNLVLMGRDENQVDMHPILKRFGYDISLFSRLRKVK